MPTVNTHKLSLLARRCHVAYFAEREYIATAEFDFDETYIGNRTPTR